MAQTMVNFRMDEDLKKGMEQACKEMGLSMTTAFTMFATKVSREKKNTVWGFSGSVLFWEQYELFALYCHWYWIWESQTGRTRFDRGMSVWDCFGKKEHGTNIASGKPKIKTLKRINAIIKDIQRDSYEGIGKPEPLKDNLSGWWSRRIDEANRIVYCEKENAIIIASCKGHYND